MNRLIQLTDLHLYADKSRRGYADINPYDSFRQVLTSVRDRRPDGIIVTGDISGDDSAASYQHFLTLMDETVPATPWMVIPGNHDDNQAFDDALMDHQLTPRQPLALGNWQIHGLDTRFEGARGKVSARQLRETADTISQHVSQYHMVAIHHHIEPTLSWMDTHSLVNALTVRRWLQDTPGIRAVMHGHIHDASEHQLGAQVILSAPATCWQFAMTAKFGVTNDAPGFREFLLYDDGTWQSVIRRLS
ncbi:metallophosphoesterase [Alteromonas sp. ASW11-19]|uniref:Metallophosphoesterase n=1 Tax=Alteromonas salexigens TaxID=2982530 RepID=A0ABT2VIQ8_9ALTE|nr:metallophosphoesterase [Alteromonas salexigens]MCU7553027.1 metallophosphoesterase [Alteromonas salexigens]